MPRHSNQPFKTMIFDNYSRSEAALIAGMAEMVVNGVFMRKVSKVMEALCGTSFSKSVVSDLCKDLEKQVEEFRSRRLEGRYPFMIVDATYFKVRENGRIISKAFMIAYGINEHGSREILGFAVYDQETKDSWNDFLSSLKKHGLHGLLMITSDAHDGIRDAISKAFPDVPWQRCQFHFSKNIVDKARRSTRLVSAPNCTTYLTANHCARHAKSAMPLSRNTRMPLRRPWPALTKALKTP